MENSNPELGDDFLEDCPELDDNFFESICQTYEVDDLTSPDSIATDSTSTASNKLIEVPSLMSPTETFTRDPRLRSESNPLIIETDRCPPPKPSRFEPPGRPKTYFQLENSNSPTNFKKIPSPGRPAFNRNQNFVQKNKNGNSKRTFLWSNSKSTQTTQSISNPGGLTITLDAKTLEEMTEYKRNLLYEFCREFNIRTDEFVERRDEFLGLKRNHDEGYGELDVKRFRENDWGSSNWDQMNQTLPQQSNGFDSKQSKLPLPPQHLFATYMLDPDDDENKSLFQSDYPQISQLDNNSPLPGPSADFKPNFPLPKTSTEAPITSKAPLRFLKTEKIENPEMYFSNSELLTLALVPKAYPTQVITDQNQVPLRRLIESKLDMKLIKRTINWNGTFLMECVSENALKNVQKVISRFSFLAAGCTDCICVRFIEVNFAATIRFTVPVGKEIFRIAKQEVRSKLKICVSTWRLCSTRYIAGNTIFHFIEENGLAEELQQVGNKTFGYTDGFKKAKLSMNRDI